MAKIGTKPNGILYLDVQIDDGAGGLKRQRVSCDTRDLKEAEKQRREWIVGIHPKHPSRGAVVAPKGRAADADTATSRNVRQTGMTMEKLFDRCHRDPEVWGKAKAKATIRSNIRLLNERIGDVLVAEMTRNRLKALVEEMTADGYAPASIKRKLDMVSKALRMATEEYEDDNGQPLLSAKPTMPKLVIENLKDRILKPEEELLVFAALDARVVAQPARQWRRFAMFVRVLLDTGFRRGEGLLLGPDSVEVLTVGERKHPFLSLPRYQTKNGKPRMVPCSAAIIELLPELNAQAVDGKWFPLAGTAFYMWQGIRDDVKAMGGNIDDVGLHTLRHTCITRLAQGGMELQRLSLWAGHSDVSITAKRYSHINAADLLRGGWQLASNPAPAANLLCLGEQSAKGNSLVSGGNRDNLGTAHLN
jgi:integrase